MPSVVLPTPEGERHEVDNAPWPHVDAQAVRGCLRLSVPIPDKLGIQLAGPPELWELDHVALAPS